MTTKLGVFAAVLAVALSGTVQANTITIKDISGNVLDPPGSATSYTVSGSDIKGFLGEPDDPAVLSSVYATAQDFFGNPTAETTFLNSLLAAVGATAVLAADTNKVEGDANSFTTNRQYFSIKQATWTAFFQNVSGGSVTVTFAPSTFSHYTEYGAVVPIPAAAWLFGSALLGIAGVGYRRQTKQS